MTLPFTKTHEEYLLQMFEFYFPKLVKTTLKFDERGFLIYDLKEEPIHWFELAVYRLPHEVFSIKFYWLTVFFSTCVNPLTRHSNQHPVDYLFEKFDRVRNNISWDTPTVNKYVEELETRETKREENKKNKKKCSI